MAYDTAQNTNPATNLPQVDSSTPPPPPPPPTPTPPPATEPAPVIQPAAEPAPTPVIASKKTWGAGVLIGSVMAMLLLIGGLGFGLWQVRQNQEIKPSLASGCGCISTQGSCNGGSRVPNQDCDLGDDGLDNESSEACCNGSTEPPPGGNPPPQQTECNDPSGNTSSCGGFNQGLCCINGSYACDGGMSRCGNGCYPSGYKQCAGRAGCYPPDVSCADDDPCQNVSCQSGYYCNHGACVPTDSQSGGGTTKTVAFFCGTCSAERRCDSGPTTNAAAISSAYNNPCAQVDNCQEVNGSIDYSTCQAVKLCAASCSQSTPTPTPTPQSTPTPTPSPTPLKSYQCEAVKVQSITRDDVAIANPTVDKIQLGDVVVFRATATVVNNSVSKFKFTLTRGAVPQTPVETAASLVAGKYQADYTVTVDAVATYSVKAEPISP